MQKLSVDIETKVLNDLDEKITDLSQLLVEKPHLMKIFSNVESYQTEEMAFTYHLLQTFAHVYHMPQGGVVNDNELTGWLRWMKSAFKHGTIREIWKNNIEVEKGFDPAFQEFINKELASSVATKQG